MRFTHATILALILALLAPSLALAQPPANPRSHKATDIAGGLAIATGALLMVTAFDYDTSCPSGYTTHYFEGLPTQCSYIGRTYTDIQDQPTTATFARPTLMWTGLGVAGTGLLLLVLPRKIASGTSVSASPSRISATKTVRW